MDLFLAILLFVIGVILVIKGGDFFVDAASWIAARSGIPKVIIGATIVSLATTMPELLVSVVAATGGKVDMSIGNAVGSVTANIGLIMALALICMPGVIRRKDYLFKSIFMVVAAVIIAVCGITGAVSLPISIMLMLVFLIFMWDNIREVRRTLSLKKSEIEKPQSEATEAVIPQEEKPEDVKAESEEKPADSRKTLIINIVKFIVGALGIVVGSQLLVDNGSTLARLVGISERIIGITLIAVGTSLPELITTVTAIAKKQSALSVGNILGANIIDLTLIMPLASLISGQALPVSSALAYIDLPVCLLFCLIAVVPTLIRSKFSRWQGIVLLSLYVVYVVITCTLV